MSERELVATLTGIKLCVDVSMESRKIVKRDFITLYFCGDTAGNCFYVEIPVVCDNKKIDVVKHYAVCDVLNPRGSKYYVFASGIKIKGFTKHCNDVLNVQWLLNVDDDSNKILSVKLYEGEKTNE